VKKEKKGESNKLHLQFGNEKKKAGLEKGVDLALISAGREKKKDGQRLPPPATKERNYGDHRRKAPPLIATEKKGRLLKALPFFRKKEKTRNRKKEGGHS